MRRKLLIFLIVTLVLLVVYFFPVRSVPFAQLYANVDPAQVATLQTFRQEHPAQSLAVNGVDWSYVALGRGEETILFLHGMTGAQDIWWQQMVALAQTYQVIAVTYPPVDSLDALAGGVLAILDKEGVEQFNVVGSSLGGYLAQYLVAVHPGRVQRAVLANTFPPNDLIAADNQVIGILLPYLPEWLVMSVLRGSFRDTIYPAAGQSELVLAFLLEQSYGRMSKAQVVGRFRCVVDPFVAASPAGIPLLIIESDNDPLVEPVLRQQLKETYPDVQVVTLTAAGHFPYLNQPDMYEQIIADFLQSP